MASSLHGACLCDGVQYTLAGPAENVMVCYCSDCSKNAGGPYQMIARYDKANVDIVEGEDLMQTWVVTKTTSGVEKHKVFCGRCGCTLWTKPMAHMGQKLIVRTSLVDGGLEHFKPKTEYWTKLRPKFLEPFEGTEQFETMPGH